MRVNHSEDVPQVEFRYVVFTRMPGESFCRRLTLLLLLFGWRLSSGNQLPCVFILPEYSGPRSVLDCFINLWEKSGRLTWVSLIKSIRKSSATLPSAFGI